VFPEFNFQPILTFISFPSLAPNYVSNLHHRLSRKTAISFAIYKYEFLLRYCFMSLVVYFLSRSNVLD
jgi:hypothetical protein